jgi:antitoxin component YwqK of YwqJK toxin-antitoxin module
MEVDYHPNGQKYMEGAYKENLREGKWTSWYEDGTLWSEGEFVAGESHGKTSVFHPNGQLHYKGSFNKGQRVGIWTFFDENGIKIKEIDYNDSPDGK